MKEKIENLIIKYFKEWWKCQDCWMEGMKLDKAYHQWAKEIAHRIVQEISGASTKEIIEGIEKDINLSSKNKTIN